MKINQKHAELLKNGYERANTIIDGKLKEGYVKEIDNKIHWVFVLGYYDQSGNVAIEEHFISK